MIFEIPKLGRCCFCMPLRQGLLAFGYLSLLKSIIGLVATSGGSYVDVDLTLFAFEDFDLPDSNSELLSATIHLISIVFSVILIYGAHKKIVRCIKAYYYYALATISVMILLPIYYTLSDRLYMAEDMVLSFARICVCFYLIILVRSLIEELENTSVVTNDDNEVQEVVEIKKNNTIYPSVPAAAETV